MNESSNPSLIADAEYPAPQGAFPVWSKVFTRPGEKTFLEIIAYPEARARSAYIWVFLAGTLSGLFAALAQFAVAMIGIKQAAPDFGQIPGLTGVFGAAGLVGALCSAPLTGLVSLLAFIITVAILHGTARFLGGQGSFDKLAYAFGAIIAPLTFVSALLFPFSMIPFVAFCTVPILILLSLYSIFLELAAIKAVYQFGWGGSAATLFLPGILISLLCGVLSLGLLRLAAPSLNDYFQQMQRLQG